jgi:hypothetical protein
MLKWRTDIARVLSTATIKHIGVFSWALPVGVLLMT